MKTENIISIISLFLAISAISLFIIFLILSNPKKSETKFVFEGLSETEINKVKNVLDQVNPRYLEIQRQITFTKTPIQEKICSGLSKFTLGCLKKSESPYLLAGYNRLRKINVLYTDNEQDFKSILCHELLHSIIYIHKEYYVYHINEDSPCYKEDRHVYPED